MKNFWIIFAMLILMACGNASTNTTIENSTTPPTTELVSQEVEGEIDVEDADKSEEQEEIEDNTNEATDENEPEEKMPEATPEPKAVKTSKKIEQPNTNISKKSNTEKPNLKTEVVEKVETTSKTPPPTTTNPKEEKPVVKTTVPKKEIKKTPPPKPAFSHEIFDGLLRKYVSSTGKVNYAGLKKEEATLDTYLKLLESTPLASSWSRNKKMAYWINAYNAYTIKLILKNYPVNKITDLHGGKPWDVKWIKLNGKSLSLNNIENDILRPQYKDARIHFAVNCAAKSCPPLLNQAWTENNLISKFNQQAKSFINNPNFNKISEKNIQISKIFEWYAGDFDNLVEYLNKYSTTKISSKAKITYLEYNWNLNN